MSVPRRRQRAALLVVAAPLAWIVLFQVLPMLSMALMSVSEGSAERGYRVTFTAQAYGQVASAYGGQVGRSVAFAGAATALCLLVGYPLAHQMALSSALRRRVLLAVVVVPFFAPYLVRTLAWETLLADQGPVARALTALGLLAPGGRLLATGGAVVAALAYNYLPFMVLPIYASLGRLDPAHVEAAADLYAGPVRRFTSVVLPAAGPGVLAGSVLTFVPAAGDFVNAALLGGPRQTMAGNIIQSRLLVVLDHPSAAALALILTAGLVAAVLVYQRLPEDVLS